MGAIGAGEEGGAGNLVPRDGNEEAVDTRSGTNPRVAKTRTLLVERGSYPCRFYRFGE